jgi:hypothetical protein
MDDQRHLPEQVYAVARSTVDLLVLPPSSYRWLDPATTAKIMESYKTRLVWRKDRFRSLRAQALGTRNATAPGDGPQAARLAGRLHAFAQAQATSSPPKPGQRRVKPGHMTTTTTTDLVNGGGEHALLGPQGAGDQRTVLSCRSCNENPRNGSHVCTHRPVRASEPEDYSPIQFAMRATSASPRTGFE